MTSFLKFLRCKSIFPPPPNHHHKLLINFPLDLCTCSILGNLWQLSLDCLHKCLLSVHLKKGSNSALLHARSFTLINALKDFYHSDGNGLEESALKINRYNVSKLDCLNGLVSISLFLHIGTPFTVGSSLLADG